LERAVALKNSSEYSTEKEDSSRKMNKWKEEFQVFEEGQVNVSFIRI
jgi:hypothetical protein